MIWANFFHIYQPPNWDPKIIAKVATESYRPLISILNNHPNCKITLNINASLTEQLVEHGFTDILDDLRALAKKGQVEFTGSAKYHTILPLLPRKEIVRQIKLNSEVNKKFLGSVYKPRGFFPPEMCYSHKEADVIKELGFDWVMLDEISYDGKLGNVSFDVAYELSNGLNAIFRNRFVSDYIAFSAPIDDPGGANKTIDSDIRSKKYLITAMDGENLGHHRVGTDRLWRSLMINHKLITVSELLQQYHKVIPVNPLRASWSSQPRDLVKDEPYALWYSHDNQIHMLQWPLTNLVTTMVHQAEEMGDANSGAAHLKLDAALASDQYWWASAKPWWSKEIVLRETKELFDVIGDLTSISDADRQQAKGLYDMIVREVERWQKEGIAQTRANKYNKLTKQIRYIGGERVT